MIGNDSKLNRFTINLSYLTMVFSLARMFSVGMSLNKGIWLELAIVFLIAAIVRYLVIKPLYMFVLLTVSLVGSIILDSVWSGFYPAIRDLTFDLINNVINNLSGVENISPDNRLPLWMILVSVISIYTSLVVFRGRKRLLLPLLYMPIFFIYWYSFYDTAFILMVFFIFSYLLVVGYESLVKLDSVKTIKGEGIFSSMYPSWMHVVIIYSMLIALLSSTLPGTSDYIRWAWLNDKVNSAFPIVQELRSGEGARRVSGDALAFDFSTTGFQDDSSLLGGPVEIDDTLVMSIRGDRVNYLRGNVRHTYTGTGWMEDPGFFELVQEGSDFSGLSDEEKALYYREAGFSITNIRLSSTTVFSPLQPYSFTFEDSLGLLVNGDFSLSYSDGVYAGQTYFVRAYIPRAYGIQVERGRDKSLDDLMNPNPYLNLPDTISDRTIQLANAITDGLDSGIDKALAMESYLRESYEYNLDVPHVPENTDFVDYFLFQEKEGYCTYFATSLAVLLRIEGIPTRYVEGFTIGPETDEGIQEVRNSNAHAWVEAYIEPVGWITLEATPAYNPPARLLDYNPQLVEDVESDQVDGRSRDPESADGRGEDSDDVTGDSPGTQGADKENPSWTPSSFALFTLLVITLVVMGRFLRGIYHVRKDKQSYQGLDNRSKVLYLYHEMTKHVERLGYGSSPGETHFEYSNRISHKFHDFGKFGFKQATQFFVKSKYGDYIPSLDEISIMEDYLKKLDLKLKRHFGSIPYHLKKAVKLFNYKGIYERK
jgi:transglutaminase-like putative cysteine protease